MFLNGGYVDRADAKIDIEDRGLLFADGVYEVVRAFNGRPYLLDAHVQRMKRSLRGIRMDYADHLADDLAAATHQLIADNRLPNARVYWQITRGVAQRDHRFPRDTAPTYFAIATPGRSLDDDRPLRELKTIVLPDRRWHRCDMKTVMLLENVLAKQAAADAGADEAIFQRDGIITEGASTSVFIVQRGAVLTHPLDSNILPSITRAKLLDLARAAGLDIREACFTVDHLMKADEAFLCGTTTPVQPIVEVDRRPIATGRPGAMTTRLHEMMIADVAARTS